MCAGTHRLSSHLSRAWTHRSHNSHSHIHITQSRYVCVWAPPNGMCVCVRWCVTRAKEQRKYKKSTNHIGAMPCQRYTSSSLNYATHTLNDTNQMTNIHFFPNFLSLCFFLWKSILFSPNSWSVCCECHSVYSLLWIFSMFYVSFESFHLNRSHIHRHWNNETYVSHTHTQTRTRSNSAKAHSNMTTKKHTTNKLKWWYMHLNEFFHAIAIKLNWVREREKRIENMVWISKFWCSVYFYCRCWCCCKSSLNIWHANW